MRKSLLVVSAALLAVTAACSSDISDVADQASSAPSNGSSATLSGDSVDTLVSAVEEEGRDCVAVENPTNMRVCIGDNMFLPVLYVFNDDEGNPERVFAVDDTGTYGPVLNLIVENLLPDVPAQERTDALADDKVTEFGDVAVKGGDEYVVIAADPALAEEPFPQLPQLDGDAVAQSLQQTLGLQCKGTAPDHNCNGPGGEANIGPVSGPDSPVTMMALVDVTTEGEYFGGVPEFFEAAGIPLTEQSITDIAECQPKADMCTPTAVTESGLLTRLMPNFEMTQVDVFPMPTFE
ncbi:hypothetical protein EK0264_01460 [Epidermidibacterium keratini]|uniref:Uncharacterized protein n=1 Tax=Epidermidibacterium keratini TaxID=1891644 RepID=A0A7L4YIN6_9ACTN|nr:hypothetical protein [Epidermidibacterium keratini]QHB99089.1 hypothetical protein EK0264_01460 [Epidermidibacterium keratini]